MAKVAAYGTALRRAGTLLTQLSSLSGPNLQSSTIDVTTHDSASAVREFVAGLIDAGEISGEMIYDPNIAAQQAYWTDTLARTTQSYTIVFPHTGGVETVTFNAMVTGFGPIQSQPDGAVTTSFTLKVSGVPTWS